ncbi:protein-methionine-sulfoxide reductase heme-binding subunit MsrQ [Shewanella sp. SNU WT4]|uniref:protein-methionine-sulfoxide reductase heme-binding subunit MsrQ n=1 Tax=Shewanella sp. SNU WT4 TaxID=2590015 RepID=UPI0011288E26|nr:protein-methionine-sulfoxide reductase heme-binding subunit MsrQ [Shewanella sp. SNU WT4]QDF67202.1 protein-methionine-sulfoxide reductase heme-binding subunit MsrQ [Shewanella sp. SNU WT4]
MAVRLSYQQLLCLKITLHLIAIIPIALLMLQVATNNAGGDPVEYIIHFTGIGALNCLIVTLLISPLAKRLKFAALMNVRRLLGLYVFFYASLHVLAFISLDLLFDWRLFFDEVLSRPYILLGVVNWLLLLALAITSVSALKTKMGRRWQSLHNSIYLVALLAVWHFYWSLKSGWQEPLWYLLAILLLLAIRTKPGIAILSKV